MSYWVLPKARDAEGAGIVLNAEPAFQTSATSYLGFVPATVWVPIVVAVIGVAGVAINKGLESRRDRKKLATERRYVQQIRALDGLTDSVSLLLKTLWPPESVRDREERDELARARAKARQAAERLQDREFRGHVVDVLQLHEDAYGVSAQPASIDGLREDLNMLLDEIWAHRAALEDVP